MTLNSVSILICLMCWMILRLNGLMRVLLMRNFNMGELFGILFMIVIVSMDVNKS